MMEAQDTSATESILPKPEPIQDGYSSSTPSTPEAEGEVEAEAAPSFQDVTQVQKRKGGRKPVGCWAHPPYALLTSH